jgi:hypothetical protein
VVALLRELRIRGSHLSVQGGHQLEEKRVVLSELVAVADCAADDPPQHVAAPLVRGLDAVHDEEGAGADVIRDDAQRRGGAVAASRDVRRRGDQPLEEIDVVVAVHALHDGGDALEAHAGVDGRLRQRRQLPVRRAVVLHEDEVPDLDVAVAILVRRARRPARHLGAVVVEDLRTRAAGTSVAHRPEVVLRTAAGDALRIDADLLAPDAGGLLVVLVHRHPQPLAREHELARDQLPRVGDGLALEIVAEAEVAEHLEEGVVARGVAHVLEVVVLAARPHAAL